MDSEEFIRLFLDGDRKCLKYLEYCEVLSPVFDIIFKSVEFLTEEQINIYFDFIEHGLEVSPFQLEKLINFLPKDKEEVENFIALFDFVSFSTFVKVIKNADLETLATLLEFIWYDPVSFDETYLTSFFLALLRRRDTVYELRYSIGNEVYPKWLVVLLLSKRISLFESKLLREYEDAAFDFIDILASSNLLGSVSSDDLEILLGNIPENQSNYLLLEYENLRNYVDINIIRDYRR